MDCLVLKAKNMTGRLNLKPATFVVPVAVKGLTIREKVKPAPCDPDVFAYMHILYGRVFCL